MTQKREVLLDQRFIHLGMALVFMFVSAGLWAKSDLPQEASLWKLDMGLNYGFVDHASISTKQTGFPDQVTDVSSLMGQFGFYMGFSNKRWGIRIGGSDSDMLEMDGVASHLNDYQLNFNSLWSEAFYTFYRADRLGVSAVVGGAMLFYDYKGLDKATGLLDKLNDRSFSPYVGMDMAYRFSDAHPVSSIRTPEFSVIAGLRGYYQYLNFQASDLGVSNDLSVIISLGLQVSI